MAEQQYEEWIAAVREATDIIEVIGRHVALKRKGRNYWGLCPFHNEKTPSFSVDPEQKLFYCFGCHAGGTVFTFLVQREGKEFKEVVEALAQQAGIAPLDRGADNPQQRIYKRLRAVLEWTVEYFLVNARQSLAYDEYLQKRKISPALCERFELGYAPDQWEGLVQYLTKHGVTAEEMEQAGVVVRRRQSSGVVDRWRDRLMFPIWDRDGHVVGFGGRALSGGQEPKYLNSPETPLFRKGTLLYASHWARAAWRRGQRPLVVEGYFDVIACHQAEVTQAVATLGTSFTEGQARYLARFHQEVDMLYDQDSAGQEALERAFMVLSSAGLQVNCVRLPDGVKDPDECVARFGVESLREGIEQRMPYLTYIINQAMSDPEIMTPRGKAKFTERIKPLWNVVGDPVEKMGYLEQMAQRLRINPSILAQSFGVWQDARHTFGKNRHNMERTAQVPSRLASYAVQLLALLLRHPDQVPLVMDQLQEWVKELGLETVLADIAAGTARDRARWVEIVDLEVRPLVVEAVHYQGPDGGIPAINDYIAAIARQRQVQRWNYLKERIQKGDAAPELLEEVRREQQQLSMTKNGVHTTTRQGKEGYYGAGKTRGASN